MHGNGNNPDPIIIRLEVIIPPGYAAPQVVSEVKPQQTYKRPLALSISEVRVQCRIPGSSRAKVFARGGSTFNPTLNEFPAKVYAALVKEGDPDPGPTPAYASASTVPSPYSGLWNFSGANLLDGVDCAVPPLTYWLHIWHEYSDGTISKETQSFTADCYGKPECAAAESELACGGAPVAIAFGWTLEAAGFVGQEVEAFNGRWDLFISDQGTQGLVISNRPTTSCCPRVRLSCDGNFTGWKLEFLQGSIVVSYGAGAFVPTQANVLTIQSTSCADPKAALPACITARPA